MGRHFALLASLFMLWSCNSIYDDLQGCHIYVDFRYDYNMSAKNLFAEQCDKVELFVFNPDGILQYRQAESGAALAQPGFRMPIPVDYGKYTVVAWVGNKDSYELANMEVGITTQSELNLRMRRNEDGTHNKKLEALWHGVTSFTYSGDVEHTYTVPLLKNTNTVNLKLVDQNSGTQILPGNISAKITAANGHYDFSNKMYGDDIINYLPYAELSQRLPFTSYSFSILRLLKGEQVHLSVIDKISGASMLPTAYIDLVDYLLMTKPDHMADQEYLDREDTWNIEIGYQGSPDNEFVVVVIKINGWVIWQQGTDL